MVIILDKPCTILINFKRSLYNSFLNINTTKKKNYRFSEVLTWFHTISSVQSEAYIRGISSYISDNSHRIGNIRILAYLHMYTHERNCKGAYGIVICSIEGTWRKYLRPIRSGTYTHTHTKKNFFQQWRKHDFDKQSLP